MSFFVLNKIDAVVGKQQFFELVINGDGQFTAGRLERIKGTLPNYAAYSL